MHTTQDDIKTTNDPDVVSRSQARFHINEARDRARAKVKGEIRNENAKRQLMQAREELHQVPVIFGSDQDDIHKAVRAINEAIKHVNKIETRIDQYDEGVGS